RLECSRLPGQLRADGAAGAGDQHPFAGDQPARRTLIDPPRGSWKQAFQIDFSGGFQFAARACIRPERLEHIAENTHPLLPRTYLSAPDLPSAPPTPSRRLKAHLTSKSPLSPGSNPAG